MKSFKAIFRRGQNAKLDGQNTADNISRTSSITNLDVEQQQKGGNKGAKPKKTASRDRLDKIGEAKKNDKKGVTKNNNKLESGDNPYPSIDSLQEEEFLQLRRQLQEMAQEKTNLALQLGEQKGQLNILQKEIQKLKSFQEESNNKVEYLTEENTMLRNRLRDVAHSPLSDNEKQQLLFDSHRHHSSAPASIATNLIDEGNGGDTTCTTPDWDKHSSSNVSEVSVACLQDKINQMQETHYSTNEELQATLQELTDLQRQLTELQQENERLNEEKTLMMDSLCRQTERLNESRSEVESLKQMLYQEKDDTGQFESVADREQKLVDLLKSTQEERETLMSKLEQINNELQETRSALLAKDEMIRQLAERVRTLECTLDAKHAEHKQMDQELTQVKDQCSGKQIEINRLTDLLDNAKTKINELEQDRALSDKSELDEMLDNARKEKDALESEVAHLKEQLAISRNETEKLKEQVSILQEEVKVTRNNAKTTQSDLEYKCEKILKEKTSLSEQLQEFQDAINELQVQSQCQLDEKRQLSAVLSETQRNLSEAERKNLNLESEVQELNKLRSEENEEWEKFQNDLLTSVRVANDFKTEAQLELQRMILENKTYRDRERQLKAEIEKLKGQKNQEDTSGTSTSKSSNKETHRMDSFIKRPNKHKDKMKKTSESQKLLLLSGPNLKKIREHKPEPQLKPVKRRENKSLKNKRYKTLSIEEEVLLDSLDKWYKNIDSKLSDENLTEEEKVIRKLKVIYENDHLKTKPVAPKPKDQLAVSKPLLDSVLENPKLREILINPMVRTIEDMKSFEEHTPEVRRLIQNIDRLAKSKSEDLTKLTDKKRISIIGRSMSYELKSHAKEAENSPAGLYRTFQTEDLRMENPVIFHRMSSVIPSDSISNISIDAPIVNKHSPNENIKFATLERIVSSIPKNISDNQLTSEQKFAIKLKEALDEAQRKNTLRKLANVKKLPISAPLMESVIRNPRLKNILNDPTVGDIVRRNSDTSLSDVQKTVRQSKSCDDITFAFDSHAINMYSDDSFREKLKFSSSSSETFSGGEFNVETGYIGPYNSENFKDLKLKRLPTFFAVYNDINKIEPQNFNLGKNPEIDSLLYNETLNTRKCGISATSENYGEIVQKVELRSGFVEVQHSDFCSTSFNNEVLEREPTFTANKHLDVDESSKDINDLINKDNSKDNIEDLKKINIEINSSKENVVNLIENDSSSFEYIEKFIEIEKLFSSKCLRDETVFSFNEIIDGKADLVHEILVEKVSSLKGESSENSKVDCDDSFNDEGLPNEANIIQSNDETVKHETELNSNIIFNEDCDLTYNETLNRVKKDDKSKDIYKKLEELHHLINEGNNDCIDKIETTRLNNESLSDLVNLSPNYILEEKNKSLSDENNPAANPSETGTKVSDIYDGCFDNDLGENVEFINEDMSDSFFFQNYNSMFSNEMTVPDIPVTDLDASLEIHDFTPYDHLIDFSTEVDSKNQEYDYHDILRENRYGVTSPLHLRVTFKDVVKEIKAKFCKDDDDDLKEFEESIGEDDQDKIYNKNLEDNWDSNSIAMSDEYKDFMTGFCDRKNYETYRISENITNVCDDTSRDHMSIDNEMEEILEKYLHKPVSKIITEPADELDNLEYDYHKEDQSIAGLKHAITENSENSKINVTGANMAHICFKPIENVDLSFTHFSASDDTNKENYIVKMSLISDANLNNVNVLKSAGISFQSSDANVNDIKEDIEIVNDPGKVNKKQSEDNQCYHIRSEKLKGLTSEEIELVRLSQRHIFSRPLSDLNEADLQKIGEITMNYSTDIQELQLHNLQQRVEQDSSNLQLIHLRNTCMSNIESKKFDLPIIENKLETTVNILLRDRERDLNIKKQSILDVNDRPLTSVDEINMYGNEFEIAHQDFQDISEQYVINISGLSEHIAEKNNSKLSDSKLDTLSNMELQYYEKDVEQHTDHQKKYITDKKDNQLTSFSKFVDTIIEDNSLKVKSGKDHIKLQGMQNREIKFKINPFRTKEEKQTVLYPKKVKNVTDHFEKISLSTSYQPVYSSFSSVKFDSNKQLQKTDEKKPLPLPRSRNQEVQESVKDFDITKAVDSDDKCLRGTKMTDLEENFSDHESENVMQGIPCPDINRMENSKVEVTEVPGLHETQKLLPESVQETIDEEKNNLGEVVAIKESKKFLENQINKEDCEKNVDDQHNLACGADPSFSSIAVAGKVERLDLTKPSISNIEEINAENQSNLNLFHMETPSFGESYLNLFKTPEEKILDHYGKSKLPKNYINVAYLSEGSDNDSSEEVDRKKIVYLEESASKPKIIDFVPLDEATKPVFNKDNLNAPSYDTLERETAFHILNAAASSAKERKSLPQLETESGSSSQKTSSKTSFSAAKKVFEALVEANSEKKDLNKFPKRSIEKESSSEVGNSTGVVKEPTNIDSNV